MLVGDSGNFVLGLIAATLLAASMWSGAAFAYTPEQQQACTPDAMRLCGAYVPDVDRITACMIENKSQLSPGCRVYFRAEPVAAVGRPMAVKPVAPKSTRPKKPVKPET
jgi:hypothetical protein